MINTLDASVLAWPWQLADEVLVKRKMVLAPLAFCCFQVNLEFMLSRFGVAGPPWSIRFIPDEIKLNDAFQQRKRVQSVEPE